MQAAHPLTPSQLSEFLLQVATVRPVFIWGPPGIGKSALVQQFAADVGLDCVSLLGSQLAPEDLIGVPQIEAGVSRFCPPSMIARQEPYCLFLDELNACSQEVQKAFYSLIHERRIGDYRLPEGSIVIGAGNRAQDAAMAEARGLRERIEDRLPPGWATRFGHDRADDVDQLREASDLDAVAVVHQRDQRAADDQRVLVVVDFLDQTRSDRPAGFAQILDAAQRLAAGRA